MIVREGMTAAVLTVGPDCPLRDVAKLMTERNIGAAVVVDPDGNGPGIVTERDILRAYAEERVTGNDPVRDYTTHRAVFAAPDWSLERAADEMVRGSFRHLIVVDGGSIAGVLSMRDIVTCWAREGATSEMPS